MNIYLKNGGTMIKMMGLMMVLVLTCGAAQAQPQQGFLSRLIQIKYGTELYLSAQIKTGSGRTQNQIDSAYANYNIIRWKIDGLVYQISSKMIVQNSPSVMKQLDAWSYEGKNFTVKKQIQYPVASLKEIEQYFEAVIAPAVYPSNARTLNLTTNVFYLIKDSYTIVKGLSDLKTKKVMALIELLDHTRLMAPGELAKLVR